jgi:copper chaperone
MALDLATVARRILAAHPQELPMKLHIESMTCGGCARSVTATVKDIDPAATVDIDLPTKTVQIQSAQPLARFTQALDEAGFPPQVEG